MEVYGASNLLVWSVVVLTNSCVFLFLLFQVGPRQLPPCGGPGYWSKGRSDQKKIFS